MSVSFSVEIEDRIDTGLRHLFSVSVRAKSCLWKSKTGLEDPRKTHPILSESLGGDAERRQAERIHFRQLAKKD